MDNTQKHCLDGIFLCGKAVAGAGVFCFLNGEIIPDLHSTLHSQVDVLTRVHHQGPLPTAKAKSDTRFPAHHLIQLPRGGVACNTTAAYSEAFQISQWKEHPYKRR